MMFFKPFHKVYIKPLKRYDYLSHISVGLFHRDDEDYLFFFILKIRDRLFEFSIKNPFSLTYEKLKWVN